MPRAFGAVLASSRVEHHVRVEHAPHFSRDERRPWHYAVATSAGIHQAGACATRQEAYACAFSTLRGMIALERIRRLAR